MKAYGILCGLACCSLFPLLLPLSTRLCSLCSSHASLLAALQARQACLGFLYLLVPLLGENFLTPRRDPPLYLFQSCLNIAFCSVYEFNFGSLPFTPLTPNTIYKKKIKDVIMLRNISAKRNRTEIQSKD